MAQIQVNNKCIMCGKELEDGELGYLICRAKFTRVSRYRPYGNKPMPHGMVRALLVHKEAPWNGLICTLCRSSSSLLGGSDNEVCS